MVRRVCRRQPSHRARRSSARTRTSSRASTSSRACATSSMCMFASTASCNASTGSCGPSASEEFKPGCLAREWDRARRLRCELTPPCSEVVTEATAYLMPLESEIEAAVAIDEQGALKLMREYFRLSSLFREVDSRFKEFTLDSASCVLRSSPSWTASRTGGANGHGDGRCARRSLRERQCAARGARTSPRFARRQARAGCERARRSRRPGAARARGPSVRAARGGDGRLHRGDHRAHRLSDVVGLLGVDPVARRHADGRNAPRPLRPRDAAGPQGQAVPLCRTGGVPRSDLLLRPGSRHQGVDRATA